ncbi:hypothetical protein BD289DRAFT_179261 [Coniella lustricola]|uniref:Uncharacterized protein n=1 Tax=Coniella lustricola TaxID=2025994 RepID=A0A2T3ADQ5_9PEZI|nr:hypothetical protein BD289DRAFT_179261 [Coniella lustricola]
MAVSPIRQSLGMFARRRWTPLCPLSMSPTSPLSPPRCSQVQPALLAPFHSSQPRKFLETTEEITQFAMQVTGFLTVIAAWRTWQRVQVIRRARSEMAMPSGVSWLQDPRTKPETQAAFFAALQAGFDMAHAQPPARQHRALREATFSIPAELVRLNPDTPDINLIKLEDVGPVPSRPSSQKKDAATAWHAPEAFAPEDTRVFLYAKSKTAKADTVFLTINVDFPIEEVSKKEPIVTAERLNNVALRQATLGAFLAWYEVKGQKPGMKERFEPGPTMVVFILRDKAFISPFDPVKMAFTRPRTTSIVFGLTEPHTSKII